MEDVKFLKNNGNSLVHFIKISYICVNIQKGQKLLKIAA